jgi:hypothetical protein
MNLTLPFWELLKNTHGQSMQMKTFLFFFLDVEGLVNE